MTELLYRFFALILLLITIPLLGLFFLLVRFTSKGPFIFRQVRAGKDKKKFVMYKIRTMFNNAEKTKRKYLKLNEADGPVFKIRNDPRYTQFGKWLSHTGLDELPQLINVLKGEMSFVGPRPLPIEEAKRVAKKYQMRFSVLPGITSSWIVKGSHKLTFDQWMKLDIDYIKRKSIGYDIQLLVKTVIVIVRSIFV